MNYNGISFQYLLNKEVEKGKNRASSLRRSRRMFEDWCLQEWAQEKYVYFATFTFKDEYLPFNRKSFVDYLRRTCKIKVILYEDYGSVNDRFHLHGFISVNKKLNIRRKDYFNKYGYVKLKHADLKSVNYCIKYATKFSNRYDLKEEGELKLHCFRTIKTNPKNAL